MADAETKDEQGEPIEIPSLDFLKHCVFNYGKYKKDEDEDKDKNKDRDINMAADAAYLDMCRTLSKSGKGEKNKRDEGVDELRKAIKNDLTEDTDYDTWHNETCKALMAVYNDSSDSKYDLFYGQAQKWLNMTMKYLLVLGYDFTPEQISKFHAPIDEYVVKQVKSKINNAESGHKVRIEFKKWSRIQIEEVEQYKHFQDDLQAAVKDEYGCRILWEFKAWNEEIENKK